MSTRVGLSFRPKACMRCGGDAYFSRGEDIEWRCLQCGRLVADATAMVTVESLPQGELEPAQEAVAGKAA
jgi:ribosomal protein L37AE/L43A